VSQVPKGSEMKAISLVGSNGFTLRQYLRDLTSKFAAEYGPFSLEHIDCQETDLEHLKDSLLSSPFLSPKKMLILHSPSKLTNDPDQLEQLFNQVPDDTEVIFVDPKIDKRTSLYKMLKKTTDFKQFDPLSTPQSVNWLVKEAKQRQADLSASTASYLIERVGANQDLLYNELKKLVLYNQKIDNDLVDLLTEPNPQSSIFELLDAALSGQTKRSLKLYREQRQLKIEPQYIIAMLTWQLHILALVKSAKDTKQLEQFTKLSPYTISKSSRLARDINMTQLKSMVGNLLKLDTSLKSKKIEADEALEYYLLTLKN
jgi:DNA polymerase-3 subunit delta